MEIRKAYPTDAYTLIDIRDKAWKNNYYDILPNDIIYGMHKYREDDIRHLQDQINENNRILVAIDNDKIIGFVFYGKSMKNIYDCGEIREIYVLSDYQGKGIGKKLFDEAVNCLKQLKFSSFIVSCPVKNKCIDFFIHMGGIKKETFMDKFLNYPVDCQIIYYDILDKDQHQDNDWNELYLRAQDYLYLLNDIHQEVAVIASDSGNLYVGLGIKHKVCPIEVALSNMYLGKDDKISKILILNRQSKPVLPCGKCRDLLIYLGQDKASILFDYGSLKTMTLRELNPYYKDEE